MQVASRTSNMDSVTGRSARSRWRRFMEQVNTLGLALVVALIFWLIAINQENPIVIGVYSERLPVTVRNIPEGLLPVQDLSKETVQVTLQAPRSSWDSLSPSDFTVYLNLAGLTPGVHDVQVTVDGLDPRVSIVDVQRQVLRVQLDQVITKEVPVRVEIMDTTAFGYDWQQPIVDPISVTVSGPESQVNQVTMAKAEVFLRSAKSQVERNQAVTPQNAQGQPVTRVDVIPAMAHVVVPVEQWPGRKEVAVRVNLIGQPAPGYRLSTVRVNPATVVLLGATDVLAQVPGFVETEPVALEGATGDIQRRLQLLIPQTVTVLEGNTVDVVAGIAAIEGGATVRHPPLLQNLAAGLEAAVALETVDVILSGSLPLLESLGPDDIFVILDLSGLLPGNHIVTPRVVVPNGIRVQSVLPQSVEVVITVAETPTPDPALPPLDVPSGTATPTGTPAGETTSPLGTPEP